MEETNTWAMASEIAQRIHVSLVLESMTFLSPLPATAFYLGCPATFGGNLINKLLLIYCSISRSI